MHNSLLKKIVSLTLIIIMVFGAIPINIYASTVYDLRVNTEPPEDIRSTSAILVGEYIPLDDLNIVEYGFKYYENVKTGKTTKITVQVGTKVKLNSYTSSSKRYESKIDGLKENTSYTFYAYVITNDSETHYGNEKKFNTTETKPNISITSASTSSDGQAYIKGLIKTGASDGTIEYGIAYGTSESDLNHYPLQTSPNKSLVLGTGRTPKEISGYVKGLQPGTKYVFKIYASRRDGTTTYSDKTLTAETKNYYGKLSLDDEHIACEKKSDNGSTKTYKFTYKYDNKLVSGFSISKVEVLCGKDESNLISHEMKRQGKSGSYYYTVDISKLESRSTYMFCLRVTTSGTGMYYGAIKQFETDYIQATGLQASIKEFNTNNALPLNSERLLEAKVTPSNADENEIIWESSDESILKVTNSGKKNYIVGIAPGNAVLTCKVNNTSLVEKFNITVGATSDWGDGPRIRSTSSTDTSITFSWTRPTCFWDDAKVAYRVEKFNEETKSYESKAYTVNLSYTDDKLDSETTYKYRVIAYEKDNSTTKTDYTDYVYIEARTKEEEIVKRQRISNVGDTAVISITADKTVADTTETIKYTVTTGTGVSTGIRLECNGYYIGGITEKDKSSTKTQFVFKPTSRFTTGGAKEVIAYVIDDEGYPIKSEGKYASCVLNINGTGKVDKVGNLTASGGQVGEDVTVSFSKPSNVPSGTVYYSIYINGAVAKEFYESKDNTVKCTVSGEFFKTIGSYKIEVYAMVKGMNQSDVQPVTVEIIENGKFINGEIEDKPINIIKDEDITVHKNVKPDVTGLEPSYNIVVGEPLSLSFTVTDPAGGKVEKVTVKNDTTGGDILKSFDGSGSSRLECKLMETLVKAGSYKLIIYVRTENFTQTENDVVCVDVFVTDQSVGNNETLSDDKNDNNIDNQHINPEGKLESSNDDVLYKAAEFKDQNKEYVQQFIGKLKSSGMGQYGEIGLMTNEYSLMTDVIDKYIFDVTPKTFESVLVDTHNALSGNYGISDLVRTLQGTQLTHMYKDMLYTIFKNSVQVSEDRSKLDKLKNIDSWLGAYKDTKALFDGMDTIAETISFIEYAPALKGNDQFIIAIIRLYRATGGKVSKAGDCPDFETMLEHIIKVEKEGNFGNINTYIEHGEAAAKMMKTALVIAKFVIPLMVKFAVIDKINENQIEVLKEAFISNDPDDAERDYQKALNVVIEESHSKTKLVIDELGSFAINYLGDKIGDSLATIVLGPYAILTEIPKLMYECWSDSTGFKGRCEGTTEYNILIPMAMAIDTMYREYYIKIESGNANSYDYTKFVYLYSLERGCMVIMNEIAQKMTPLEEDKEILKSENKHLKNTPINKWKKNPNTEYVNIEKPELTNENYYYNIITYGYGDSIYYGNDKDGILTNWDNLSRKQRHIVCDVIDYMNNHSTYKFTKVYFLKIGRINKKTTKRLVPYSKDQDAFVFESEDGSALIIRYFDGGYNRFYPALSSLSKEAWEAVRINGRFNLEYVYITPHDVATNDPTVLINIMYSVYDKQDIISALDKYFILEIDGDTANNMFNYIFGTKYSSYLTAPNDLWKDIGENVFNIKNSIFSSKYSSFEVMTQTYGAKQIETTWFSFD